MVKPMGGHAVSGAARSLLLEALEELKIAEVRELNNEENIIRMEALLSAILDVATKRTWQPILRKKTLRRLLDT
jgi:hypothetical protein